MTSSTQDNRTPKHKLRITLSQRLWHTIQSAFVRLSGSGIVGITTDLALMRAVEESDIGFDHAEGFHAVQEFSNGSEGQIFLIEGRTSKKLFILKRVRSNVWNLHCRANEPRMLGYYTRPHPRIINMRFDMPDPLDSSHWLIYMEYCSGGSLFDQYNKWIMHRRQHMPEVFLLHVIIQMAEALAYLHFGLRYIGRGQYTQDAYHAPMIHGDIKDENILLRWSENPTGGMPDLVLADFGTAKLLHDREARVNAGTPGFNAPEDMAIIGDCQPSFENIDIFLQAVNNRSVAADMYSFGLVAYMFAEKAKKPIQIGTDPSTVEISREYKTSGLVELIRSMLAVDPRLRAEASFDPEKGILPQIHQLRKARDRMIAKDGPLDPTEWLVIKKAETAEQNLTSNDRVDSKLSDCAKENSNIDAAMPAPDGHQMSRRSNLSSTEYRDEE
ncbi:Meiosis-specific serine/threonine-protein kinase mek1 [Pseudocercospora fuligena]|uniref:non-specific serine/threonine protein kinase n=1 Tax=Pseudocercospora fuligena TaxID=685502 RepID=A0A8H6RFR9_9PEZI|nr:Meiosis-specific serine/threonine-protein kinase mek1 [Pseudocercospora fuligena]